MPTVPEIGSNLSGNPIDRNAYAELRLQNDAIVTNNRLSNIGADNPAKAEFPLPRTLFYDGALLDPGVKEAEKYGLFMFYSFGGGEVNYLNQYYVSERHEYNRRISSPESKNPTAFKLVQDTISYSSLVGAGGDSANLNGNPIIGKTSAPYYLKDFIYCKYYGTIPNNRLITLRRFSSPVLDNFSLPKGITDPVNQKKGIGIPLAQAVSWFGGKSGNSLSELINFTTGLNWTEQQVEQEKTQQLFGDGLLNSEPLKVLVSLASQFGGAGSSAINLFDDEGKKAGLEGAATVTSDVGDELASLRYYKAFRDAIKNDPGRFGILSERIWVPVDVIQETKKRDIGLDFTWEPMNIKFTYDLTSAGEVNSKAALFDILGNLLSLSTNYGNFITPEIRYDSTYSALTFPRGEQGAKEYHTDLESFLLNTKNLYLDQENDVTPTIGGNEVNKALLDQYTEALNNLQNAITGDGVNPELLEGGGAVTLKMAIKALQSTQASFAADKWQAPLSLYSGAPIGEWHLVIGNPYNPIAMIGNLICSGCSINFGESLGPDDFPTTIEATITVEHGRNRERGEIESIFNRGDGRLYQSVKSTSANSQTFNTVFDVNGDIFNSSTGFNFLNPDTGLPGSQGSVLEV